MAYSTINDPSLDAFIIETIERYSAGKHEEEFIKGRCLICEKPAHTRHLCRQHLAYVKANLPRLVKLASNPPTDVELLVKVVTQYVENDPSLPADGKCIYPTCHRQGVQRRQLCRHHATALRKLPQKLRNRRKVSISSETDPMVLAAEAEMAWFAKPATKTEDFNPF